MLTTEQINHIRQFNRRYTQALGLLNKHTFNMALTFPEGRVLIEIGHQAPISPMTIAKRLGLDKSYTSRLVKQLEKKKIITKKQSTTDRRSFELTLTPHGQQVYQQVDARSNEQMAQLLAGLTPAQQQKIYADVQEVNALLFGGRK